MIFLSLLFWLSLSLVVYTYLGYPLLIALIARIKPTPDLYFETFPSITFLIPAYNEEAYISKKLDNTLSLDYPRDKFQILVAADGSSDQTAEIVKSYSRHGVELSYVPDRNGKMAAIVRAVEFARGEIVVFSDANNMYDRQAIRELILPFSDPKVGATTGAKLIVEDGRDLSSAEGLYWKYESAIKKNESMIDSCVSSVGEILAIRKDAFIPPKEKIINDDHYIILDLMRRGYRVIYTSRARSYEYVSETAGDEVERRTRMNAGLYQTISMSRKLLPLNRPLLVWQTISHKYLRAFLPFAFIALYFSNMALFIFNKSGNTSFFNLAPPAAACFFYLQSLFYAVALTGSFFSFKGRMGKLLYLPAFLLNSNFATLMGFYKFIANKQTHVWKRVRR
jgi:poly-beta-1,6-N-acetyl-D-glucosamine synthase